MSGLLLAASLLLAMTALLHAVLGELLIVRHLRRVDGLPPIFGSRSLPRQTLQFTWHLPSILGAGLAVILARYAQLPALGTEERFVIATIAVSLLACAGAVFLFSRGRHPGWAAFLATAVLCWMAIA
jgi:hypothetical protein